MLVRPNGTTVKQEPDACLAIEQYESRLPFLVLEAVWSKNATQQVRNWIECSKGYIKYVVVLELQKDKRSEGYRVVLSIIKPVRKYKPTEQRPNNYHLKREYIVRDLEVYPTMAQQTFEISFRDLLGPQHKSDPSKNKSKAVIDLGPPLWKVAKHAVRNKIREDARKGNLSPPDPDQALGSSSSDSSDSAGPVRSWTENDDDEIDVEEVSDKLPMMVEE